MGGAKKLTLAQVGKRQQQQATKQEQKQKSAKTKETAEKKVGGIDLKNVSEKELIAELTKMKAITPYQVATRYNLKISAAKNLLSMMERRGFLHIVAGNSNLRLYRPVVA